MHSKKTFVFVRDAAIMLKLAESLPEARALAAQEPNRYTVGSSGWVTVKLAEGGLPPQEIMSRWIAESYRLMAGQSRSGKGNLKPASRAVKTQAPKKPTAKRKPA